MNGLFVALGIMVLALLALLLWFVPHLLQKQASDVAKETEDLRKMLLDVLNEQQAVTTRQTQLGSSMAHLQDQLATIVETAGQVRTVEQATTQIAEHNLHQLEVRLGEVQSQIKEWFDGRQQGARVRAAQDNEAWAHLMGLLATIQERVGTLSKDRASVMAGLQAGALLEELEQEMQNLRNISEEIAMLQWRLRRSLNERESNVSTFRMRTSNGA
jgi:cell division protein ZapA (FtsZ GTPase activity inhibitor)